MASSNRHWPSMFKSKPCNTNHHHQWQPQHDIINPSPYHRTPYTPGGPGCEERTPEPKPRWNPRPEQIRILEAIFNSGMVNPPRDEIRKIRAQLQEYGQVGDANVFYWFQNRKSRSKHKQRQLQNKPSQSPPQTIATTPPPVLTSSTSSSSDKTSPNNSTEKSLSVGSANMIDLLNSPTGSVNQTGSFFNGGGASEFLTEPFFFPVQKNVSGLNQGFCFPDVTTTSSPSSVVNVGDCGGNFLLSELMLMSDHGGGDLKKNDEKMKFGYGASALSNNNDNDGINFVHPSSTLPVSSPTNFIFPGELMGPTKSTVFINDVCFEVGLGPFNVREAFGDDAVLLQSSGQPVLTNEWGVTLGPLQHGGFYYLLRAFAPTSDDRTTIDLI